MNATTARRIDDMSGTEARELLARLIAMAANRNYDDEDLGSDVRVTLVEAGLIEIEDENA
jgi:hypothetical protein